MPINYQLGKIYKIVNNVNNIIYIGSTAQKTLSARMCGHRRDATILTNVSKWSVALRTIGAQHFTIILVHAFPCNSKDELESEEYRVLDAEIAAGTPVYNSIIGGKPDTETKAKISVTHKGKKLSDETKAKLSAAHQGKTHSDESKAKMSAAQKGENNNCFQFGSLRKCGSNGVPNARWTFKYVDATGKRLSNSFSIKKYGDYGAKWRAEEVRKQVYPEYGTEEDCTCDDFGAIEWD